MQKNTTHARKIKITLSLSRIAIVALDRIATKRFEHGESRREVSHSRLVEESIQLLKRKEGL